MVLYNQRVRSLKSLSIFVKEIMSQLSLCQYFKPRDGLPDPKGLLSSSMLAIDIAIALANQEVEKALRETSKKRAP